MSTPAGDLNQHAAVRIGDAERDECLDTLAEHHVRGRLSVEEFERRQQAALTALTHADLAALLADLPPVPSTRTPLAAGLGRWSLDPEGRTRRITKWVTTPLSLTAGGVPGRPDRSSYGVLARHRPCRKCLTRK